MAPGREWWFLPVATSIEALAFWRLGIEALTFSLRPAGLCTAREGAHLITSARYAGSPPAV